MNKSVFLKRKNEKGFLIILTIAIILSITTGCMSSYNTTSNKGRIEIEIDAYGNDNSLQSKKYILASGDTTIKENNLQYIEFAEYVKKALSLKGYIETYNANEADLFIFFRYGISDPETFERNVTLPVWGQTGISSTNTTGNVYVNSMGNNINYNQTTTSTPKYGFTGTRSVTQSITNYLRYFTLTVLDYNIYKVTEKEKIVWNTIITSSGTSGDIRRIFPYLVVAGQNYFGKSSGERKEVTIFEGDERINQLKGISNNK